MNSKIKGQDQVIPQAQKERERSEPFPENGKLDRAFCDQFPLRNGSAGYRVSPGTLLKCFALGFLRGNMFFIFGNSSLKVLVIMGYNAIII